MTSLAIIVLVSCASYGGEFGTLKGTVRDPTGAVMSGVLIRVEHWGLNPSTHKFIVDDEKTMYTDGKGGYSLELPPGAYDIFFSSAAFSPVARKVEVKGGKVTLLSPKMKYDRLTKFVE
jgi:hypothetical protein